MSEEQRAAAYRRQKTARAAFRALLQTRLAGQAAAAATVRENFRPLLEATRYGQAEPEEKRPAGIVNA